MWGHAVWQVHSAQPHSCEIDGCCLGGADGIGGCLQDYRQGQGGAATVFVGLWGLCRCNFLLKCLVGKQEERTSHHFGIAFPTQLAHFCRETRWTAVLGSGTLGLGRGPRQRAERVRHAGPS